MRPRKRRMRSLGSCALHMHLPASCRHSHSASWCCKIGLKLEWPMLAAVPASYTHLGSDCRLFAALLAPVAALPQPRCRQQLSSAAQAAVHRLQPVLCMRTCSASGYLTVAEPPFRQSCRRFVEQWCDRSPETDIERVVADEAYRAHNVRPFVSVRKFS